MDRSRAETTGCASESGATGASPNIGRQRHGMSLLCNSRQTHTHIHTHTHTPDEYTKCAQFENLPCYDHPKAAMAVPWSCLALPFSVRSLQAALKSPARLQVSAKLGMHTYIRPNL